MPYSLYTFASIWTFRFRSKTLASLFPMIDFRWFVIDGVIDPVPERWHSASQPVTLKWAWRMRQNSSVSGLPILWGKFVNEWKRKLGTIQVSSMLGEGATSHLEHPNATSDAKRIWIDLGWFMARRDVWKNADRQSLRIGCLQPVYLIIDPSPTTKPLPPGLTPSPSHH